MKWQFKSRWHKIFFLLALCYSFYQGYQYYTIYFPNRSHAMIDALKDMQTYCIGRHQINLPKGSTFIRAESSAGGDMDATYLVDYSVSKIEAQQKIEARWEELKERKNKDDNPDPITKPPQRFDLTENSVIFTFNHHSINLNKWPDGTSGTKYYYKTQGYLWRNNKLYRFEDGIRKEEVIKAMQNLTAWDNTVFPVEKGFCGGSSFFAGEPRPGEKIWFAFRLPTTPKTELRISIPTEPPPKEDSALFNNSDFFSKTVRDSKLTVHGMKGLDWIESSTEKIIEYETLVNALWYYPGGADDVRDPPVLINLDISAKTAQRPPVYGELAPAQKPGELGQKEFLALWDGILPTFKPRPGAF